MSGAETVSVAVALADTRTEAELPGLSDAPCPGHVAWTRAPASVSTGAIGHPNHNVGTNETQGREQTAVDMKLEVVVVPVSDVDKARDFYQALGWRLDADVATGDDFRVVQLTPPGSACSIIFGTGITSATPGSAQGLNLVVTDIDGARNELLSRGADVSEVFHDAGGVFHHAGTEGRVTGPAPDHQSYGSFLSFSDPDGNGWFVQEITTRLPGR
jgi:catechol 2,3-dioxygenase-like lactoylglutathione lyase family enzyme